MTKKSKVFKPCTRPRYLIGSVRANVWKADLMQYNAHRYKVFTAVTKTDTKPPKMNPFNYVNLRKLKADAERLKQIDKENKAILKAINVINRTSGRVDTFIRQTFCYHSHWINHEIKMKQIVEDNKVIYKKIAAANSSYKAYNEKDDASLHYRNTKYPFFPIKELSPDEMLAKEPSISEGLDKIGERPLCFMDFKVEGGPSLGRIIIELYHDHVPVTVQNFLAICSGINEENLTYKRCVVYKIIPGKFLETGDITHQNGRGGTSIYGYRFDEEGHKLKHTKAGVLSMVRNNICDNNSKFCITFGNMQTLDKQNVVFGKIIKGINNLMNIEGYGRKIGKPLAPIYISNCGKLE